MSFIASSLNGFCGSKKDTLPINSFSGSRQGVILAGFASEELRSSGFCFLKCSEVWECIGNLVVPTYIVSSLCDGVTLSAACCHPFTTSTSEEVQNNNIFIMKHCYIPIGGTQNIYKATTVGILPLSRCALTLWRLWRQIEISVRNISKLSC